jgi:hypothetical protein
VRDRGNGVSAPLSHGFESRPVRDSGLPRPMRPSATLACADGASHPAATPPDVCRVAGASRSFVVNSSRRTSELMRETRRRLGIRKPVEAPARRATGLAAPGRDRRQRPRAANVTVP